MKNNEFYYRNYQNKNKIRFETESLISEYNFSNSNNLDTNYHNYKSIGNENNNMSDYIWKSEEDLNHFHNSIDNLKTNLEKIKQETNYDRALERDFPNTFTLENKHSSYKSENDYTKYNKPPIYKERYLLEKDYSMYDEYILGSVQSNYEELHTNVSKDVSQYKQEITDQKIKYEKEIESMKQNMIKEINKYKSLYQKVCENYEKRILQLESENLDLRNKAKTIHNILHKK